MTGVACSLRLHGLGGRPVRGGDRSSTPRAVAQMTAADGACVYLLRGPRRTLARLDGPRRAALLAGLLRAGQELQASAERLEVAADWARGTWPRRRYPQQCYAKTLSYAVGHPEIADLRLVHGVASHAPR